MRILMVAQFYAPVVGGEERMVEELARALTARGHDVAVATLRSDGLPDTEEQDGVRIHRLPGLAARLPLLFSDAGRRHAPPAPDPETVRALGQVVRAERPDVVHGHNWLAHAYLPLRSRTAAAYVLSLHDYSLVCATKRLVRLGEPCSGPGAVKCVRCASAQYGPVVGPPTAALTRVMGQAQRCAADAFLPVSDAVAQACGLPGGRTPWEVIPNFVADDLLAAADPADPALEALPDGDFLLFAGDVVADKGVGVLLEAHAGLRNAPPLVLAGRPVDPALAAPRPGVIQLGALPRGALLAAWSRCTVAVAPSLTPESFGLVALEAMTAGRPVVAARSGGLPDVVADTGVIVPPGDVPALRAALAALLADPARRTALGAAAARRAFTFTASRVIPRVEAAYEQALDHARGRRHAPVAA